MINHTKTDRVRYTLSHLGTPSINPKEPRNWKEDDKEYARNLGSGYDGMFMNFSNSLEFTDDGMRFILFVRDAYGEEADVYLKREEMHPITDVWTETYLVRLDLYTILEEENLIKVKVSSGGIQQVLKTRENEKVELDRVTTLDGAPMDDLETYKVQMDGRKIFLLSKMEETDNNLIQYDVLSSKLVPPLTKTISSDEHIITTRDNLDGNYALIKDGSGHYYPEPQQFFYDKNDRYKVILLEFDLDFWIEVFPGGTQQWPDVYLEIRKYDFDDADTSAPNYGYTFNDSLIAKHWTVTPSTQLRRLTYSNLGNPFPVTLQKNQSLMFIIWRDSPFTRTKYKPEKTEMIITEHSFFEPTQCKMIIAQEMGERLTEIITGKKAFYSEALGRSTHGYPTEGSESRTGFAHGFWLREYDKEPQDETNKFKPLATSWRDFLEAMRVTKNLSVGIDLKGKRERLRMEPKSFFYQPKVLIKLPNVVNNIQRTPATEFFYSGIEIGYDKGGQYEESMGLDEYNGKSTFTTAIKKLKNIFSAISPFRTDSYGAEFARRKTIKYYPLEDTRYDQDIFQFALRRLAGIYQLRKWQDDFEELPKNVYSPDTAYNLIYSPVNLILRHGKDLATSFIKYPLDYIRYASSTANSKLTTKLIGGEEISESGDILNSRLGRAKISPQWVDFEHECNFEVMEQVEGFSTVLGKEVPNFYGLVEYKINDLDDVERGYLFNLKPNGVGNWRILKYNK